MPVATRTTTGKVASPEPLLNQQERFRVAFELANIGIGVIDQTGKFIEVNSQLSDIFGIGRDELIGMHLSDLPVPRGDSPAQPPDKMAMKGDPSQVVIEKRVLSRQGNVVWVEVSYASQAAKNSCLRVGDLLGRWGGEEFLILLPDTGPSDAEQVCERIRASLEARSFPDGVRITASFGVVAQRPGENFAALVARADAAMYQAKQTGRNRVSTSADDLQWESKNESDHPHFLELYWRKHYECGIPEIDAEHQELVTIANSILSSIGPNGNRMETERLVDELMAHIVRHFKREEHLLEANGFPNSETHRRRHHQLLSHADDLAVRFREKETTAGALLGFIVHDVVARHMIQEDREYFPWLKKQLSANRGKHRPRSRKPAA